MRLALASEKSANAPEQKSTRTQCALEAQNRSRHDAYREAAGIPHNRVPWRPSITAGTLMQGHTKGTVTAYAPFGLSELETTIQTRTLRH